MDGFRRHVLLRAVIGLVALAACAGLAPASASAIAASSWNSPLGATYSGWAYVTGSGAQSAWKWSAQGWAATTMPPGKPVYVVPWGSGWTWTWADGAWYALQTPSLASWTCQSPAGARYTPAWQINLLRFNGVAGGFAATLAPGDTLTASCANGFRDASGGTTTFLLVTATRGVASLGTGYVDAAAINAASTTQPAPTPTPAPSTSTGGNLPAASCGNSLQSRLDAATAGSTVNVSGCVYSQSASINKSLTLVGGRVTSSSEAVLTVNANNVTINGTKVFGTQHTSSDSQSGIVANNGSMIHNLTILNCEVGNFGGSGIDLRRVSTLLIQNCYVHDMVYTGIRAMSVVGGRITSNTVRHIGVYGASANGNNAYGIMLNNFVTGNLATDPLSADVVVDHNLIEDVPTWHGIDTHAGQRLTFSNNTVRDCMRAMFLTSNTGADNHARNLIVTGNLLIAPTHASGNDRAITLASVYGVTITGNTFTGWTNGNSFEDYQNGSTGVVMNSNTTT